MCNPDDKSVLWGFISKYAPDATPQNAHYLDHMTSFAVNYYNDFVKTTKIYLQPTDTHKELLKQIIAMLSSLEDDISGEEIQNLIYSIGKEADYENLREFFKEMYQILLGETQGPRLGSFFKLYGISETIDLIQSKIN